MKLLVTLVALTIFLSTSSKADDEKGGSAWSDIKKGTRSIVKGAGKGIKKVTDKIDENIKEDEAEERAESQGKKKK